jgi:hypothetical protein
MPHQHDFQRLHGGLAVLEHTESQPFYRLVHADHGMRKALSAPVDTLPRIYVWYQNAQQFSNTPIN